ncbi:hypothetical protein CGRA01v4_12581 [Colletotrichum graminicola]|nr:hypothetical protein CGRA01v4_12581 [Colletotrichum graminicola]
MGSSAGKGVRRGGSARVFLSLSRCSHGSHVTLFGRSRTSCCRRWLGATSSGWFCASCVLHPFRRLSAYRAFPLCLSPASRCRMCCHLMTLSDSSSERCLLAYVFSVACG